MRGVRKNKNSNEILLSYLEKHPTAKWKDEFRNNASADDLNAIYDEIYSDQRGICAYCEIALKWPTADFTNDFRIEHFHPENCGDDDRHNYSLDWNNLLGCCHGGTQKTARSYGDPSFGKKHHSCDAPKGNKILDNVILNPLLDLHEDEIFFTFKEDGCVLVSENCPPDMKNKALATIKELNLDCDRLRSFRASVIDELRENIEAEEIDFEDEGALDSVILSLREDLLGTENKNEFYSTIDWYLAI